MSDPELIRALSDLTLAVRGGIPVTIVDPRREASIYYSGRGIITAAGTLVVWAVPAEKRFLLKGFIVTAVVTDTLAAASGEAGILYFLDDADSDRPVCPIGAFDDTAAIGTWFNRDVPDLGSGIRGSALGSNLKIAFYEDIGGGNIEVQWCVWGDEIP